MQPLRQRPKGPPQDQHACGRLPNVFQTLGLVSPPERYLSHSFGSSGPHDPNSQAPLDQIQAASTESWPRESRGVSPRTDGPGKRGPYPTIIHPVLHSAIRKWNIRLCFLRELIPMSLPKGPWNTSSFDQASSATCKYNSKEKRNNTGQPRMLMIETPTKDMHGPQFARSLPSHRLGLLQGLLLGDSQVRSESRRSRAKPARSIAECFRQKPQVTFIMRLLWISPVPPPVGPFSVLF